MIHWRQLIPWLLRAWPVLALIPVGAAHAIAIRAFPADTVMVNKLAGMSLQVLGGLLVLYSVNDNLGLFRSQSLSAAAIAWFKAFPFVKQPITLRASGSASATASGSLSTIVIKAVNTIEERLAEVERMLAELRSNLAKEVHSLNSRIEDTRSELGRQITDTSTRVADLSKRLEYAAVGSFKFQALGVLLALYGAVTSVFA